MDSVLHLMIVLYRTWLLIQRVTLEVARQNG
jgi:hypothetical protein